MRTPLRTFSSWTSLEPAGRLGLPLELAAADLLLVGGGDLLLDDHALHLAHGRPWTPPFSGTHVLAHVTDMRVGPETRLQSPAAGDVGVRLGLSQSRDCARRAMASKLGHRHVARRTVQTCPTGRDRLVQVDVEGLAWSSATSGGESPAPRASWSMVAAAAWPDPPRPGRAERAAGEAAAAARAGPHEGSSARSAIEQDAERKRVSDHLRTICMPPRARFGSARFGGHVDVPQVERSLRLVQAVLQQVARDLDLRPAQLQQGQDVLDPQLEPEPLRREDLRPGGPPPLVAGQQQVVRFLRPRQALVRGRCA